VQHPIPRLTTQDGLTFNFWLRHVKDVINARGPL